MSIPQNPDLILCNANIITLDPLSPRAHLVAIGNGKILGIGHNKDLVKLKSGETEIIDCKGKVIVPGFIDAHMHLTSFAESLASPNLGPHNGIQSILDIQSRIQKVSQSQPPGTWVTCRGYHEFHLKEKRHPTRWDLDLASSVHPIKLTHRSGHAHVLNSVALKMTGISKETPDPEGGIIERDLRTGEPTGVLYGMSEVLSRSIPPLDSLQGDTGIEMASRELLTCGITSVQDASARNDVIRWEQFKRWKTRGYLRPRVTMMLGVSAFKEYRKEGYPAEVDGNHLSLGGVKIMVDEVTGRLHPPQKELNEQMFAIHSSGFQAAIHAIEEPAIEAACNAIEYVLQKLPRSDHRHRIEHCSVCPPTLAKRLASLGVTVITQPPFIYYNGDRYLETVPPSQLTYLYPLVTLIKNRVHIAGSSDCPVVQPNPLIGIYSACSRMSETGKAVQAEEGVAPLEALRMYTTYAARAAFEEDLKGSIQPGKLADLVVLSADPTHVSIEEIRDIEAEMTILNGEIVWNKGELADNPHLGVG
jgi:predicted amidohydrolase YtcJ